MISISAVNQITPPVESEEVQLWRLVINSVRAAHAALSATDSGALAPAVAEALTEACVTGLALRAAAGHSWDAETLPAAVLDRHLAELALEALTGLVVAVPGRIRVGESIDQIAGIAGRSLDWFDATPDPGRRQALRAALEGARLPETRAEDLKNAVAQRVEQLQAALTEEWSPQADVCLAGLPLFSRPVADVMVLVALGDDVTCSDVVMRRFSYRQLGRPAPEGLTPRHLERSAEILADVLDGAR